MGKHDVRNILLGGGILAALYFLFGGSFKWPGGNGGNGTPPPPGPGGQYVCPQCGATFNTYAELLEHLNTAHIPPEPEVKPGLYSRAVAIYGGAYTGPEWLYYRYGSYKGWTILFVASNELETTSHLMDVSNAIGWNGWMPIGNWQSVAYYNANTLGELYYLIDSYGA